MTETVETPPNNGGASTAAELMQPPRFEGPGDLPEGDYAIVEIMGHRKYVGRISTVTQWSADMLCVEPLFDGTILEPVLHSGASLFAVTRVTRECAFACHPRETWQLPATLRARLQPTALEAPVSFDDADDEDEDPDDDGDGEDEYLPY